MSEPTPLASVIGSRLRQVRRQQELSLADVEERSLGACKAVALSAYERGVRGVTVARLAQLASLYEVPVSTLLAASPTSMRPAAPTPAATPATAPTAATPPTATTEATATTAGMAASGTAATVIPATAAKRASATTAPARSTRTRRRSPLATTGDANGRGRTLQLPRLLDTAAGDGPDAELLTAVIRFVEHITHRRGDHNGRVLTLRDGDLTTIAVAVGCRLPELLEVLDANGVTCVRVPATGTTSQA